MAERKFSILTRSKHDKVIEIHVSDAISLDEANDGHPSIVVFFVSERYTEDEQRARANTYVSYLNRVAEATRIAYEQNQLIDMIKA